MFEKEQTPLTGSKSSETAGKRLLSSRRCKPRESLPSLDGKVAIVTGSTSGIGLSTARRLAELGAHVIMACRNVSKGNEVVSLMQEQASMPLKLQVMELQLSSLAAVRRFAEDFLSLNIPLHLLINNAGLVHTSYVESKDNLEEMFAVNYLAHFYLTLLLLDKLQASAPARVVNVASAAHEFCKELNADLSLTEPCKISGPLGWFPFYGRSKLCNVLFSNELALRLKGSEVISVSLHPGTVNTNIGVEHANRFVRLLLWPFRIFMKDPEQGSDTTMHCACSPQVVSGKYYVDSAETECAPLAQDTALAQRLWAISCDILAMKLNSDMAWAKEWQCVKNE